MLNAVQELSQAQRNNIDGIAFYGYTMNEQLNGQLPGFPSDKLQVFCRRDDGVCGGRLVVTAGHLAYGRDGTIEQGAQFLISKMNA